MSLSSVPVPRFSSSIFILDTPVAVISIDYSPSAHCICTLLQSPPVQSDQTRSYTASLPNITIRAAEPHPIPSHLPNISDSAPLSQRPTTRTPQPSSPLHPESPRYIWAFAPTASQTWPFPQWPMGPPSQQCPCRLECVTARRRRQTLPIPQKAKRLSYQHPAH